MPQLDKVTFLSQFFWLCFFFLGFYIVSLKYFLPQMSRILKYRKKRLNQSNQGVGTTQDENSKIRDSSNRLLEDGLKFSKDAFKNNLQRAGSWVVNYTEQTNQTKLKDTNHVYLHSLGERCLSHNLSVQGGFNDFSSALYLSMLLQKIKAQSISKASIAGAFPQLQRVASKQGKQASKQKGKIG